MLTKCLLPILQTIPHPEWHSLWLGQARPPSVRSVRGSPFEHNGLWSPHRGRTFKTIPIPISFSISYFASPLECNVFADRGPIWVSLQIFSIPLGSAATGGSGTASSVCFYKRLISMQSCLNCLLEGWGWIKQYPLALDSGPFASHLFLYWVKMETWHQATAKGKPKGGWFWSLWWISSFQFNKSAQLTLFSPSPVPVTAQPLNMCLVNESFR